MSEKSKKVLDFEHIIGLKKQFTKFISEQADNMQPPAFGIFAEALLSQDFSSQQELSTFLGVNKAHTSRTLSKMQERGLIVVEPKRISLTEEGRKFAEFSVKKKDEFIQAIFSNFSEEEMKTLSELVNKIFENAKTFCKE